MARSLKKGPFIHHTLDKKVQANIESGKRQLSKLGLEHL
jgi:small subunit ribosomal protein S19